MDREIGASLRFLCCLLFKNAGCCFRGDLATDKHGSTRIEGETGQPRIFRSTSVFDLCKSVA